MTTRLGDRRGRVVLHDADEVAREGGAEQVGRLRRVEHGYHAGSAVQLLDMVGVSSPSGVMSEGVHYERKSLSGRDGGSTVRNMSIRSNESP